MGSFHVLREVAICERHDTDVAVNFLEDDYQRSRNRCIRWSVGALYHVHTRSTQRAIIDGCPVGWVFRATKSAQNGFVLGAAKSFSGSIDECTSPGLYYCSPSGNLPDLGGGTSAWYYIIVIGRLDVCQYVFKNQGEKLAIRTKTNGQSWTAWKVFSPS